jgi:exonuclease SbcD
VGTEDNAVAKFLHIADIHLGFDRYDCRDRTKDFFYALKDVLERYAIGESVDFVVIAGDLFEHRNIQPAVLNQAQLCLQQLQAAQIPVLAIEGNHDNRPYGTPTSWLRYLADWGLLKLLEPNPPTDDQPFYSPWDPASKTGGYIDLDCGVRVVGSAWYGASAPQAVSKMAAGIAELPPGPPQTVALFHHGLEGQIARYAGAVRLKDLLPLKEAGVDYLALGHIHKQYSADGWIFNPGSLEANNVEEGIYQRGAYLVELDSQGIRAELKQAYRQRPIVRLIVKAKGQESPEELAEMAQGTVEAAIAAQTLIPKQAPIVELRLQGQVGFDRSELDVRALQKNLQHRSNALIFLLKYEVDEAAYGSPLADSADRQQVEREVFLDLLSAHRSYRNRAGFLAQGLISLKDGALSGSPDDRLYEQATDLLLADPEDAEDEVDADELDVDELI